MTEHNHENKCKCLHGCSAVNRDADTETQLDVGSRSLAEALRISFVILKFIMVILVVLFVGSGFFTVGPDEQAMVLRFGKIKGVSEARLLEPGAHWAFPYPVDQIIKIPVRKVQILPIDSFWYYETEEEKLGQQGSVPKTLLPGRDGYCLTRNDSIAGVSGNDYNIVHSKWQLSYRIDNPERFFKNVYIREQKPGESYSDVIAESIQPLLESLSADAIDATMVRYSIDDAILSKAEIVDDVSRLLQDKLDGAETGISVVSMQLTGKITWPRQVDDAFQASVKAGQEKQKLITEAGSYAENTLNEAGGETVYEIIAAMKDPSLSETDKDKLWDKVAGQSQEKIADARAYRTRVVESAKANADYLRQLLPEYRKRPQLVIQKIYQDAVEYVLNNSQEKIIVQPVGTGKGRELRILINRDPAISAAAKGESK